MYEFGVFVSLYCDADGGLGALELAHLNTFIHASFYVSSADIKT